MANGAGANGFATLAASLLQSSSSAVARHYAARSPLRWGPADGSPSTGYSVRERLSWFRDHLACEIRWISPVLTRLCTIQGIDLDALVEGLAPRNPSRRWVAKGEFVVLEMPKTVHLSVGEAEPASVVGPEPEGDTLANSMESGLPVSLSLRRDQLEADVALGPARLRSRAATATLSLPFPVPEMLFSAGLRGMPVDAVVAHPFLQDSGWVIQRVSETARGNTNLHLLVGRRPWLVPWARTRPAAPTVAQGACPPS